MRIWLLIIFFIPFFTFSQESINWMSWDDMISERKTDTVPKKVFIDLYTSWCGWCKRMDATTFKQKAIVEYMNQKYYAVKLSLIHI